ncbi:thermonuclease family protein [Novosphingobium sp. AP12]|uniref:thermonuclease family protein n=1 Tax=Novosphingobium sp. AP12 TaxID=1144305 RepID=UPI0002721986|nr:thermonuclease family protein [Novosphingobium sp. AP12]EJL33745.1 hypothetical protein PMI02_00982 [Novosphingobium sp. AP12]
MSFLLAAAAGLCIASVHDGDTIRLCDGERVRLAGIDAPEVNGSLRCALIERSRLASSKNPAWCDYTAGNASRDHLKAFLGSGRVSIERVGTDKDGWTLAHLYVRDEDAGDYLVAWELARPLVE